MCCSPSEACVMFATAELMLRRRAVIGGEVESLQSQDILLLEAKPAWPQIKPPA